jgi:hypothetical protein
LTSTTLALQKPPPFLYTLLEYRALLEIGLLPALLPAR